MARAGTFGSFGQEPLRCSCNPLCGPDPTFTRQGRWSFHPSFDLTRWNVVTTRFPAAPPVLRDGRTHATVSPPTSTLRKKRIALTSLHAINLGDEPHEQDFPSLADVGARLGRRCFLPRSEKTVFTSEVFWRGAGFLGRQEKARRSSNS